MIIGNNNTNNFFNDNQTRENNNFNRKMKKINENKDYISHKNPFVNDLNSMQHSNPTDKENMRDKSLAMLHDRLKKGTISLEEFNKKVKNINNNK